MADTPTTRLLLRKQSLGSNTNTWGDTKLNTDLDQIDRAMVGYQAYTVTGDATLSWTNYSASNDFAVFAVKLIGSPAAACTITVNSTQMRWKLWNACGVTVTIKTSAGSGVAVRNGNIVDLICDATDVVLMTATQGGKASPTAASNDIPAWSAVESAIATASIPAAAGTILNSGTDTTPGYHLAKHAAASANHTWTTQNGGADEDALLTIQPFALIDGGTTSGAQAVAVNSKYLCDYTATSYTLTLPAAPTAGDMILLTKFGTNTMTLALNGLKFNGSTSNPTSTLEAQSLIRYTGASRGWVEM